MYSRTYTANIECTKERERDLLVKFSDIVPGDVIQPGARLVHLCLTIQHNTTTKKEIILIKIEFGRSFKDLGTHLEREEQFVPLKKPPAGVLVDGKRVEVVEVLDAFLKAWMLETLIDGV